MPLQGQSLWVTYPCISTYCFDVDGGRQLASIRFTIEPRYLRVFHHGVSLETLALIFGLYGVKGISLARSQSFSVNGDHPQELTQVTEAKPQAPPAIATDNGEVGESLPCNLTSICLVLS